MLFTTPLFIFFFFAVLLLHAALRGHTARKWLLLIASYAFYAAWEFPDGLYCLALLISTSFVDYWLGLRLYLTPRAKMAARKRMLIVSLMLNLGSLVFFKYLGFFATTLNDLASLMSADWSTAVPRLVLPLGISFFTFQSMSYTIDAYRRRGKPYRSLLDFLFFVAFFPQLIAGPIVRAEQFRDQLRRPADSGWKALDEGARIALVGVLLKVAIADNVAPFVDIFYRRVDTLTSFDALMTLYSFPIQVFCDFAGYSLIAAGLARCFGYRLPKNFHTPFLATTVRDLWRRWHITLANWLRDYLYIPLGGSRFGLFRWLIAVNVTWFLAGLWHGAGWNFVLWGVCQGVLLTGGQLIHMAFGEGAKRWEESRTGKIVGWFLTFHAFCASLVIFRAHSLGDSMRVFTTLAELPSDLASGVAGHTQAWVMLPFIGLCVLYHIIAFRKLPEERVLELKPFWAIVYLVAGWLFVEIMYVGDISFIYFAF